MSIEQEKKIQSLYASLKTIMNENYSLDEQEQFLEWTHKLLVDTSKEKKLQSINKKIKLINQSLDPKTYSELITQRKKYLPINYPSSLQLGDIVHVNYGFGYCSEISDSHYGIIFSEYIAGLYLVLPLSSEPLKKYEIYLENLDLPCKEPVTDKKSYIQFNHARYIYYRRLENINGCKRKNIGEHKLSYLANNFIKFLSLPIDK